MEMTKQDSFFKSKWCIKYLNVSFSQFLKYSMFYW